MTAQLTFFLSCLSFSIHAQTTFTGRVFDADTRLPIKGVEIKVDTIITTTNAYGFFQVNSITGKILLATIDGYRPQSIKIPIETRFAIPLAMEESLHQTELSKSFYMYVGENIDYPQEARRRGVHGLVMVYFEVDSLSRVIKTDIIKPQGAGCTEEVVRVLNSAPRVWFDIKRNTQFVLPVRFRLGNTKMKEVPENPAPGTILLSEVIITAYSR